MNTPASPIELSASCIQHSKTAAEKKTQQPTGIHRLGQQQNKGKPQPETKAFRPNYPL